MNTVCLRLGLRSGGERRGLGVWSRGSGRFLNDGGRCGGWRCRSRWGRCLDGPGFVRRWAGFRGKFVGNCGRGDFGRSRGAFCLACVITLNSLLLEETEHVVEDEVTIWLLGEEKALDELAPWATLVGHFADDEDGDTTICRGLRVYGMNKDFAVLESHGRDFVVDFLLRCFS
jgi:hypothetical protein